MSIATLCAAPQSALPNEKITRAPIRTAFRPKIWRRRKSAYDNYLECLPVQGHQSKANMKRRQDYRQHQPRWSWRHEDRWLWSGGRWRQWSKGLRWTRKKPKPAHTASNKARKEEIFMPRMMSQNRAPLFFVSWGWLWFWMGWEIASSDWDNINLSNSSFEINSGWLIYIEKTW